MNAKPVFAVALALASIAAPLTSQAVTLNVDCDQPKSKLPTINTAVKMLGNPVGANHGVGADTINVSGACVENVVIEGFDQLTVNGLDGASISDASGGTAPVVAVTGSRVVTINNVTVSARDRKVAGIQC